MQPNLAKHFTVVFFFLEKSCKRTKNDGHRLILLDHVIKSGDEKEFTKIRLKQEFSNYWLFHYDGNLTCIKNLAYDPL